MWKTITKVRVLLTPKDKRILLGVIVLMAISALAEMVGISMLIGVIALFLNPEAWQEHLWFQAYRQFIGLPWHTFVILHVLLIGIAMTLKNAFALFVIYCQSRFVYRKQSEFCIRLFNNYIQAPYCESIHHSCAERMSHLSRTFQLSEGILLPLAQLTADLMVISVLSLVLLFFIPEITLSGVLCMALISGITALIFHKKNKLLGEKFFVVRRVLEKLQHTGFSGIKTIKAYGKESAFCSQYEREQQKTIPLATALYTVGQFPRMLLESSAFLLLCILFVVMLSLQIPVETILLSFSMIVTVMARILPAVSRCNYNLTLIRQYQHLLEIITNDLTQIPPENLGQQSGNLTLAQNLVIENLTFSYGGTQPVFDNFSLEIPAKSSLGISGKTGRGKTTLIDLLLGLLRPQQGRILADGVNVYDHLGCWRSKTGYVPQDIFIAEGVSIAGNIALGVPPEEIRDEKITEVLKLAQLDDWVNSLPEKQHHILTGAGTNLSGGQRQRIGIARALYRDPELLLLDEATSALDNETEKDLVETLDSLKGKVTMIIIAHRLSTIENCDRVIRL